MHGEEEMLYGDSGYIGANKREDAIVRNKQGRKIKYKINRRPSQIKNLSKSDQYLAKKLNIKSPQSEQRWNTFSQLSREYLVIEKLVIEGCENRKPN